MAVERGLIAGPRIFFAGKALSQTGGHGDMRKQTSFEPCGCAAYHGPVSEVADGVDAVRKAVREHLRKGAHQIKMMVSGGVLSPTDPLWMDQYSDEEIRVGVEEAATRRTYVMAHAHTANAARRCAELGVRSIEHGTQIDADGGKGSGGSRGLRRADAGDPLRHARDAGTTSGCPRSMPTSCKASATRGCTRSKSAGRPACPWASAPICSARCKTGRARSS